RFVFEVPSDGASGDLYVGVIGLPMSGYDPVTGKGAVQDILALDFERVESPKRLTWELWNFYNVPDGFHHIGETRELRITGIFADGAKVLLSRSKLTKYESSAPSVVKVDATGSVTAVGPGSAKITVKNGSATAEVPITVPVE
ncbi:MAG: Ig-like domain-containing protein, partial [Bryobacteraceae bacterium]